MRFPRPEPPDTDSTSNTLSPSYSTTEAVVASNVPWKPRRLALAVATVAFVTAFASTVVLSSFRSLRSAPAAQAVLHGDPSPAASAHRESLGGAARRERSAPRCPSRPSTSRDSFVARSREDGARGGRATESTHQGK